MTCLLITGLLACGIIQPFLLAKKGLSYGRNGLATIKYHWIHIQGKFFDGGLPFPNVKCLNKNLRSNAWI
jgi:hypothetical protein